MPITLKDKITIPYVIKKLANVEISEEEIIYREIRSILNKLTPTNLQKLAQQLSNLPINTEKRLEGTVDLIFEKAIHEPLFSQTYAKLSQVLSQIKVISLTEPKASVDFQTILLKRCQKEFDTDYTQEINYDKLIQDANKSEDKTQQKESIQIARNKWALTKHRSLGNIRFIGELFKVCMLSANLINNYVEIMLNKQSDEKSIEFVCCLLTTIGKDLDQDNAEQCKRMKGYFENLERIVKKDEKTNQFLITNRIRFMILDLIDLRTNHWVPRRKDNVPRLIQDIRKEADEEQLSLQ